jgi:NADH dehydrogenase [ubiquinone] 1 alpha subcomplex assembly factor 7
VDYDVAADMFFIRTRSEMLHDMNNAGSSAGVWPWCDALADEPDGSIRERQAGLALMNDLSFEINARGGGVLVIDYGHARTAAGDTLQAMHQHEFVDPVAAPGTADLTAHVDFQQLAGPAVLNGCSVSGPVTQGQFLRRLGLEPRVAQLARANPAQAQALLAQAARLADSDQMGTLFKSMAITAGHWPAPAGFGS